MSEGHRVNSSCGTAEPIRHYTVDSKEVPSPGKLPGHLGGALCVHKQNQFGTGTSLRLNHFLCSLSKNELYFSSRSETGNIGTWLFGGFFSFLVSGSFPRKTQKMKHLFFFPVRQFLLFWEEVQGSGENRSRPGFVRSKRRQEMRSPATQPSAQSRTRQKTRVCDRSVRSPVTAPRTGSPSACKALCFGERRRDDFPSGRNRELPRREYVGLFSLHRAKGRWQRWCH